jgi:hypothetical protein
VCKIAYTAASHVGVTVYRMSEAYDIREALEGEPSLTRPELKQRLGKMATAEERLVLGENYAEEATRAVIETSRFGTDTFDRKTWETVVAKRTTPDEENDDLSPDQARTLFEMAERLGMVAEQTVTVNRNTRTEYIIPSAILQRRLKKLIDEQNE